MHRSSVRGVITAISVVGLAAFTASCASSGEGGHNPIGNAIFGAPNPNTKDVIIVDANNFGYTENCPPVSIRAGTEVLPVFQPGRKIDPITGAAPPLVYQATITDTARECHKTATGVSVRIGISGRIVAGPAGKAGTVTLPIQVVAMDGSDKVVKSDLIRVAVTLQEPTLSADFLKADETIELPITPDNNNFRFYVGFDDAPPAKKGGG